MTITDLTHNEIAVETLRELAHLIERLPEGSKTAHIDPTVRFVCSNITEMMQMRRAIGGEFKKVATGNYFYLEKTLPYGTQISIFAARGDVCQRIVTGTEMVMGYDTNAPQVLIEREIVEWICPEVLQ